jgi:hypothetical protein
MTNLIESFKAKPILFGGLALLLFIFLSNLVKLPMPFDVLHGQAVTESGSTYIGSSIGSGPINIGKSNLSMGMRSTESIKPMPLQYYPPAGDVISPDRSVVRNASMDLSVKNVSQSIQKATDHITAIGGIVTNSSSNKTEDGYYGYINARVPKANLDKTVQFMRDMAIEVLSENLSSYDQTGQVVEVDNQIADLQKELARYQDLLKQATSTDQKYQLQNQIDQLNRQIDAYTRQKQDLKGQETMSDLSLSFREEKFSIPFLKDLGLGNIFQEAVLALKATLQSLLTLAIWILVFSPIWLPIYLLSRRKNKK